VAATRPPDVSTTFTAPRTSVSAYTTPSQPPVYGTSSTSIEGSQSVGGSPGSSPAISTPTMTMSMSSSSASSSLVIPTYGSDSMSAGVSQTVSLSSSSASDPASSPSQYTNSGGTSSRSSSGFSSGLTTSISPLPTVSASSFDPTLSLSSSSQSQAASSSGVGQSSISASGSVPPIYGGSSSTLSLSSSLPSSFPVSYTPPPYESSTPSQSPSNSPPPNGGSTISSAPSTNSPPPYGGSNTASVPTTSSVTPPAETLCPGYNNRNYTDSSGATYSVICDQDIVGTPFNPPYKRQATVYTIQSCMSICDQYDACVAASTDGTKCNLFSSVTGTQGSPGAVAAYKVSGPPKNVQTVTVCANRPTAYTTVWTTATQTTCAPNSTCTVGGAFV